MLGTDFAYTYRTSPTGTLLLMCRPKPAQLWSGKMQDSWMMRQALAVRNLARPSGRKPMT
jgi:hypothetical protein